MTAVENRIYEFENPQREIMLFLHKMLKDEFTLTDKITFNNPCYYQNSWICYLKALKNSKVELAFFRGNELSNHQDILESKGRKQLRSLDIASISEIPFEELRKVLHEAIVLDQTVPYASKRQKK